MTATLTREAQFTGEHPEVLSGHDSLADYTFLLTRVDGSTVAPIRNGHPGLGWEGDPRLQMYWDGSEKRHVLMRLEHDNQYRVLAASPPATILNEEWINRMVARLVQTDARRGFDPKVSADAHNVAVDRENDRLQGEHFESMADKLRWALKRDGADNYC